jgi:hypothetical protein
MLNHQRPIIQLITDQKVIDERVKFRRVNYHGICTS